MKELVLGGARAGRSATAQTGDPEMAVAASAVRVARLRRLMAQPGMGMVVRVAGGLLAPCPALGCARIYTVSR